MPTCSAAFLRRYNAVTASDCDSAVQRRQLSLRIGRRILCIILTGVALVTGIIGLITSFWYQGPGTIHYGIGLDPTCLNPLATSTSPCPLEWGNLIDQTQVQTAALLIASVVIGAVMCVPLQALAGYSALLSRVACITTFVQGLLMLAAVLVFAANGPGAAVSSEPWGMPPGADIGWSLILVVVGIACAFLASVISSTETLEQAYHVYIVGFSPLVDKDGIDTTSNIAVAPPTQAAANQLGVSRSTLAAAASSSDMSTAPAENTTMA